MGTETAASGIRREVGAALKRLRKSKRPLVNQEDLAARLGVSRNWLSRIERGWPCSEALLAKLLGELGVTAPEHAATLAFTQDSGAVAEFLVLVGRATDPEALAQNARLEALGLGFANKMARRFADDFDFEGESQLWTGKPLNFQGGAVDDLLTAHATRLRRELATVSKLAPVVALATVPTCFAKALIYDLEDNLNTNRGEEMDLGGVETIHALLERSRELIRHLARLSTVAHDIWETVADDGTVPPWSAEGD